MRSFDQSRVFSTMGNERRVPVFGICYGEQLIAHLMGGTVTPGDRGEFGLATLQPNGSASV